MDPRIHQWKNTTMSTMSMIVTPVLIYIYGTRDLTKKEESEIDVAHRRQLRMIINHRRICNHKWKLLKHILPLADNTPAVQAMKYYFQAPTHLKQQPERRRKTLPRLLNDDIRNALLKNPLLAIKQSRSTQDLHQLTLTTQDRTQWKR